MRSVRLIHHHDDVGAIVKLAARFTELVDSRDQNLANVLRQQRLQLLAGSHPHHVRNIRGIEGGGDLCVEIDAVHDNDYRGVA